MLFYVLKLLAYHADRILQHVDPMLANSFVNVGLLGVMFLIAHVLFMYELLECLHLIDFSINFIHLWLLQDLGALVDKDIWEVYIIGKVLLSEMGLSFENHFDSGLVVVGDLLLVDDVEGIGDHSDDEVHEDHEEHDLGDAVDEPGEVDYQGRVLIDLEGRLSREE